jgi:hypothetical protein
MKTQKVPPSAAILIESMRDIGYSLETALADLIDNSITSGALKIDLFVDSCESTPKIGILDNGKGMTKDELLIAMRPGSRSPLDQRAATDEPMNRISASGTSPYSEPHRKRRLPSGELGNAETGRGTSQPPGYRCAQHSASL